MRSASFSRFSELAANTKMAGAWWPARRCNSLWRRGKLGDKGLTV